MTARKDDVDGVVAARVSVSPTIIASDALRVMSSDQLEHLHLRRGLAAACVLVGAMNAALRLAVVHASTRVQFGRPIIRFQAVRNALVGAHGEAHMARAVTARAVELTTTGSLDWMTVAAAVVRADGAASEVARVAHQVHGAMGTTEEHPLWRLTMRLWSCRDAHADGPAWAHELGLRVRSAADPWDYLTASG
jgi:acyl-CoA dehydrogenase